MATWDPENNQDRFKRSLGTTLAGERNEDSTTGADYLVTREEINYTSVDLSDDSTTVSSSPAHFYGLHFITATTASAAVLVKDDTTTVFTTDGTTQAVGDTLTTPGGVRCNTSLIIDPDNADTGTVIVWWRAI